MLDSVCIINGPVELMNVQELCDYRNSRVKSHQKTYTVCWYWFRGEKIIILHWKLCENYKIAWYLKSRAVCETFEDCLWANYMQKTDNCLPTIFER